MKDTFDWLLQSEAARPMTAEQRASWIADQDEHCRERVEEDKRSEDEKRAFEASRKAYAPVKAALKASKPDMSKVFSGLTWTTKKQPVYPQITPDELDDLIKPFR